MKTPSVTGLIIAAGLSKRMGQFKPLCDFEGEPFIISITRKLLSGCCKVIIVTGYCASEINSIINSRFGNNNISLVYNPDYEKGMFTSLQKGIHEMVNSDWVLYHFVDQPFFTEKFYSDFVNRINENSNWIQPAYEGKEGHPVLFDKKVSQLILNTSPDSSLRLIKEDPSIIRTKWICGYPEVLTDFDSKENITEYLKSKK